MLTATLLAVTFFVSPPEPELVQRIDTLQLENGLFLDRSSAPNTVSSAATGLGSYALAIAAQRGLVDKERVVHRLRSAVQITLAANPSRNRGWLSHFTDASGYPKDWSEVSTIDTALFYLGVHNAARVLELPDLMRTIEHARHKIDLPFVLRDGRFLHGFTWQKNHIGTDPDFIPHLWNDSSEGMLLYKLFEQEFRYEIRRVDYPLFVYLYPLMFFEDADYLSLAGEAIEYQMKKLGHTGVTATDGPAGYTIADDQLISPLLLSAIGPRFPSAVETIQKYSLDPMVAAYYIPSGWTNTDDLTIDLASAYILIATWHRAPQPTEPLPTETAQ